MKVRLQNNSIRFRLKQYEVEAFHTSGTVTQVIEFGPGASNHLEFLLQKQAVNTLEVHYQPGRVTVTVPMAIADEWATTELVGVEEKVRTSYGNEISLLIEKDFKCLDGSEEDNIGSYPNPMKAC